MATTTNMLGFLELLSAQSEAKEQASDAHLIADFQENRCESSLVALVHRHGAMVYQLCLRSLGHRQDAEDAFQATFLVLARQASTIRKKASVASWLHGVAFRVASRLRDKRAAIRNRERQVEELPEVAADAEANQELDHRIDEELAKLPGKLNEAIVLCDLQGLTQREAAQRCGCPEGTLSARLTRGRQLLASRLSQRGMGLSAGLSVALLTPKPGTAMTYRLLCSTAQGVLVDATRAQSAGVLSANALDLAQGVSQSMSTIKLKYLLVGFLVLGGLVGTATAVVLQRPRGQRAQNPKPAISTQEKGGRAEPRAEPAQPSVRLGTTQFRLGGRITSLEYSRDGRQLLSSGGGWGAAVWHAKTGELIQNFPSNPSWTTAAFSPDGKLVALAGFFNEPIPVWDVRTGKRIHLLREGTKAARFTPDGKYLFTASSNRVIGYDLANGKRLPDFAKMDGSVTMLAAAPTGTLIAANNGGNELRVWDWKARRELALAAPVGSGVHNSKDLEFTPDGKSLIVLAKEDAAELRDARTLTVVRRFATRFRSMSVGVSGDGNRVAVGCYNGWVAVFDLKSGKKIVEWPAQNDHVSAVALSPDGKRLACATDQGGDVRIWDVATRKELFPNTGHRATVARLVVLQDGSIISHDHQWQFVRWDPRTRKPTKSWEWRWPMYMSINWAYSPRAGRSLIGNKSLYMGADPSDPKGDHVDVFAKAKPPNAKERIVCVALSANGRYGAAATMDDRVCVCDLDRLTHARTFALPEKQHVAWNRHYKLALSPDGEVLASSSEDEVRLWEVKTGRQLPAPELGDYLTQLTFSPEGETLALAVGKRVVLWDMKKWKVRREIEVDRQGVQCIAFSPDGATLATGPLDTGEVVCLWDVATGRKIREFRGAYGGAASLAFSPDGKTLYAGTGSSLIVGWNLERD